MTEWYYHSEAELVDILQIATDNLTFRGFHYFQGTEELLKMHLSREDFIKERKKLMSEINVLSSVDL